MFDNFFKGKKVFITGHTGFKGSYLSKILLLCGAKVKGYSLEAPTNPSLFEILELDKKMDSVIGDIRDYEKLEKEIKSFKPDIVFHLAAQPIVRESYKNPRYTYDVNLMGTVNIMEAIRNTSSIKSAVIITTDKVYENKEWDYGYRECDALNGYDPYSNSKSCAELAVSSFKNSFFKDLDYPRISTVRSGNVIGGGDFAKDRIMTDSMNSYLNREDIIIRNPYSTRPYLYVVDTLNGYITLAKKQYEDKKYEGIYNFGPEDENCVSTGELVDIFCKKFDNKIKWINKHDGGPHEANFLKLDISKTKNLLGWKPIYNIDKTMDNIVEWIHAYEDKKDIDKLVTKQIKEYFNE